MQARNLMVYRLPVPWEMSAERLEEQLGRMPAANPEGLTESVSGWMPPTADQRLVYELNGQWLIRLRNARRNLPSKVVKNHHKELCEAYTTASGAEPGRKVKRELLQRAREELIPGAYVIDRLTDVWIDPKNGWFVVLTSSTGVADEVLECLRKCLDEFQVQPYQTTQTPWSAMAQWLVEGAPDDFTVDRECVLKAPDESKASVRYAHHTLDIEEVRGHIAAGKMPTKLAMTWQDRLSFVLTDKGGIRSLQLLDIVKEAVEDSPSDDRFAADFVLVTGELQKFLVALGQALGGEVAQ